MGLILGFAYCMFIFIENKIGSSNILFFGVSKCFGFIMILGGFFYTAYHLKKNLGGYITFQECLRGMLVTIAITELFYVIFNVIYNKLIDPEFFNKLKIATQAFLEKGNLTKDEIAKQMNSFDSGGIITFWSVIQMYGFAIIIDSVFAIIFASILKKNHPVSNNQTNF